MERNKDEEITYEVVLKGDKYDCTLRNFFADGQDLELRTDFPLPGGLAHASKADILEKTFENTIFFYIESYKRKSEKAEVSVEDKKIFLSVAEALETLNFEKMQKNLTRQKRP